MKHAVTMETRYAALKKACLEEVPDEPAIKKMMKKLDKAQEWYTKAEVGVD